MRTPLWRRTPPAIFPVTLGFLGLGILWRHAAQVLGLPLWIGDILSGAAVMFFVYFAGLYVAKWVARPGVLFEDLKTPPARAGVSAMAMSVMLVPAILLDYGVALEWLWWLGVVLQVLMAALVTVEILKSPVETRAFSPFQHLTYVGLIVAPIAGYPLGYAEFSHDIGLLSIVIFTVITVGYVRKLMRNPPPPPLCPSLVITLSPLSLFGVMFALSGDDTAFAVAYALAVLTAFGLLGAARWMTAGGWTPVWGAFTFPLAAFGNLQVSAIGQGYGLIAELLLWGTLGLASAVILFVLYRSTRAFVTGELSQKSAAATA